MAGGSPARLGAPVGAAVVGAAVVGAAVVGAAASRPQDDTPSSTAATAAVMATAPRAAWHLMPFGGAPSQSSGRGYGSLDTGASRSRFALRW